MMTRVLPSLFAALMAFAALAQPQRAEAATCRPYANLDAMLQDPLLHWMVVGEQHGTNEMPAAFLDLVCHAATARRPIVVAVERSAGEQADIDLFMRSDGSERAKAALTASPMWRSKAMQDGRGSYAYLAMLDRLRLLRQRGVVSNVVAFAPDVPLDPAAYEEAMAARLRSALPGKDGLVLVYVGNCHAMRLAMCGTKPAAAFLPRAETLTINLEGTGGTIWNCGGSCGVHRVSGASPKGVRKLELLDDPKAPWDAMLFLGEPVSASPPAVAKMDDPPPIRS